MILLCLDPVGDGSATRTDIPIPSPFLSSPWAYNGQASVCYCFELLTAETRITKLCYELSYFSGCWNPWRNVHRCPCVHSSILMQSFSCLSSTFPASHFWCPAMTCNEAQLLLLSFIYSAPENPENHTFSRSGQPQMYELTSQRSKFSSNELSDEGGGKR